MKTKRNKPNIQPSTFQPVNTNDLNKRMLPQIYTDLGTKMKVLGHVTEAVSYYLQALSLDSTYSIAYYNLGVIYSEMGKFKEALHYYESAIMYNSNYVESFCNIGVIYKNMGKLDEAIEYYSKALQINSNFTIARNNMAIALTDKGTKVKTEGNIKEGIKLYKESLLFNFQYADTYYNLGVAYGEQFKYNKAIVYYELAIHFNPLCCQAYNNLGVIYKELDNLEKAIQCYNAALAINPQFSQTLNNIAVIYTVQGKMDEAFESVKNAIRTNRSYSEAYNNLGVLYRDEGEIEASISCYEKCLELNPNSKNAQQNRLLALNYSLITSLNECFQAHAEWGLNFSSIFGKTKYKPKLDFKGDRPLRIGYISPDFFTHSVSYFIESILFHHSAKNCQVFCYSNVIKEDNKTLKLKKYAHFWRPIAGKGAQEVAEIIMEDKIDILVELTGHTAGNRLDVLALKPAPIQVTYIGYPNTTGLPEIDYRFTDSTADPIDSKQKYSEKLIYLPKCFLCYCPSSQAPPVSSLPYLSNGYITFGTFNNLAKINEEVISLWCQIMQAIPNSRFVVKCKPFAAESSKKKFSQRFIDHGIDSSRLILLPLIPNLSDHLQTYSSIDLSLDTFPYAGTTTTCEALWMGVPVVTLKGHSHAQNVGVSLLSAIGKPLDTLIAKNKEEYIKITLDLIKDVNRLNEMRRTLRLKMKNSYLCDGMNFTSNLEKIYLDLVHDHLKS